jgi:hypothetical protein
MNRGVECSPVQSDQKLDSTQLFCLSNHTINYQCDIYIRVFNACQKFSLKCWKTIILQGLFLKAEVIHQTSGMKTLGKNDDDSVNTTEITIMTTTTTGC